MNRRSFLGTMLAFPAIVRAESLMPVRRIILPDEALRTNMVLWTMEVSQDAVWLHPAPGISNVALWSRQLSESDLIRMTRPADIIKYG